MSWNWQEELKEIVRTAVERKLNNLGLGRQWENSARLHGLVYTEPVRREEILLCRRELDACKKSGQFFEQDREEQKETLSERLLKLLL